MAEKKSSEKKAQLSVAENTAKALEAALEQIEKAY